METLDIEKSFLTNLNKMDYFKVLSKEEFLNIFENTSEEAYETTRIYLNWLKNDFSSFVQDTYTDKEKMYKDLWGTATTWCGNIGAVYNYSISDGDDEDKINSSSIYIMTKDKNGEVKTDFDNFINYEVDLNNPDWKFKLLERMELFVSEKL